jgi:SAM-dependent methyltransferase
MVADHFSSVASAYAAHRPSYPPELTRWLASQAPGRRLAWDCGTGSGQAAVLLADEFERVVATDPSEAQLRHAAAHLRVDYRLSSAADSGLPSGSCDLVAAAQAVHWFDLPSFYAEVDRVLRLDGVLALWGYARIEIAPVIDEAVQRFERITVGDCWPPGRERATDQYRGLPFPYPRIEPPRFVMERRWPCARFLEYVRTWSAVERYRRAHGKDPVLELAAEIEARWGPEERDVRWPLHMLAGRRPRM